MYTVPCNNCKGKGVLLQYKHIEDGVCFTCYGSGVQEVTKEEYNEYRKELEQKKLGSYILFNKGTIEYYKTVKEITSKYGVFYINSYGEYCVSQSNKNKNILFTESTKHNEEFIKAVTIEYNKRMEQDDKDWKELIQNKINKLNVKLKEITEPEYKEFLTNKIMELEKSL